MGNLDYFKIILSFSQNLHFYPCYGLGGITFQPPLVSLPPFAINNYVC